MIRRKQEEDNENPDRWLVSYADFITLLFAFFVVMYSVSSVNQKKYRMVSTSISSAFTPENAPLAKTPAKQLNPKLSKPGKTKSEPDTAEPAQPLPLSNAQIQALQEERKQMKSLGVNLAKSLSPLMSEGKVFVSQNNRGIRIDINDSVLFASGSADLAENAKPVLNEVAKLLINNNHSIQVEGYTDDTPIHNASFYSNWELSSLRASSVVRMLIDMQVADNRLSALGFGSTQPIDDNTTPEGRARNRHVSIMILYDSLNTGNDIGTEIKPD